MSGMNGMNSMSNGVRSAPSLPRAVSQESLDSNEKSNYEDGTYLFVPSSEREKLLDKAPRDDEEELDSSDEESQSDRDEASLPSHLPAPMPLLSLAELGVGDMQSARIFTGERIRHVDHIPADPSETKGAPLSDPIHARKLGKWFTRRARHELAMREAIVDSTALGPPPLPDTRRTVSEEDGDNMDTRDKGERDRESAHSPNVYSVESYQSTIYEDGQYGQTPSFSDGATVVLEAPPPHDLEFDSAFESGNLDRAYRVHGRDVCLDDQVSRIMGPTSPRPESVDHEYDLVCRNDINTSGNIQWYYFSARAPEQASYPLRVRFNLTNMMKRDALYNFGMLPCVYSERRAAENLVSWKHEGEDVCYYKNWLMYTKGRKKKVKSHYSLSFTYTFSGPDTVYFAHCFPYTYTTLQRYLHAKSIDPRVSTFFRRRGLATTLAGNTCDLIVIAADSNAEGVAASRQAVVISARVHPGESNSSLMMQGVIDYLTADTPEAQILREKFIFKIVPMLNPDGVIHGNYRCSLAGSDLNRRYADANVSLHPTVYAMKNMLANTHSSRGVYLYLDLHGHSRNKNGFFYGCDVSLQSEKYLRETLNNTSQAQFNCRRLYSRVFPEILSRISNSDRGGYFSYRDSAFRVQASKGGTGRVVGWRTLKIEGSYTIELSFCGNGNNRESSIFKRVLAQEDQPLDNQSGGGTAFGGSAFGYTLPTAPKVSKSKSLEAFQDLTTVDDGALGDDEDEKKTSEADSKAASRWGGSAGSGAPVPAPAPAPSSLALLKPITADGAPDEDYMALCKSYATAKHWCFNDYLTMGHHLGAAVLKFANLDTVLEDIKQGREAEVKTEDDGPGGERDGESDVDGPSGQATDSDAGSNPPVRRPQRMKVVQTYQRGEPMLETAVYSVKAVEAACATYASDTMDEKGAEEKLNVRGKNVTESMATVVPNMRLLTEMGIRQSLGMSSNIDASRVLRNLKQAMAARMASSSGGGGGVDHADAGCYGGGGGGSGLDTMSFDASVFEELAMPDESNEDMGSDSDPSGDNLPVEEVMKMKSFNSLSNNDSGVPKARVKNTKPKRKKLVAAAKDVIRELRQGRDVSSREAVVPASVSNGLGFGRSVSATDINPASKGYVVHRKPTDSSRLDQLVRRQNGTGASSRRRASDNRLGLPRYVQSFKLDDDTPTLSVAVKNMSLGMDVAKKPPSADAGDIYTHPSPLKSPIKDPMQRGGETKTIWTSAAAPPREHCMGIPSQTSSGQGQGIIAGLKLNRKSSGSLNTSRKVLPAYGIAPIGANEQTNMANVIMSMIKEDSNRGRPTNPTQYGGQYGRGMDPFYDFPDALMTETISKSKSAPMVGLGGVMTGAGSMLDVDPSALAHMTLNDAQWGAGAPPPLHHDSPHTVRKSILRKRHSQGGPAVSVSGRVRGSLDGAEGASPTGPSLGGSDNFNFPNDH